MKKVVCALAVFTVLGAALTAGTGQTRPTQPAPPRPAASHATPAQTPPANALPVDAQNKLVAQYCATCHSEKAKAGELVLAGFDAASVVDRADVAEKMIRKLRAGMMPPPGSRCPDAATVS